MVGSQALLTYVMIAPQHQELVLAEALSGDPKSRPQAASHENEGQGGSAGAKAADAERVVIKKYANRRLYNTASSSYVTLDHLAEMVKEGVDFVVYDAKTNEDITRQVLTQIIFEAENAGPNLLPIQFLRQLIQLYGNQVQALVPGYLEMSLDAFARQQERIRDQLDGAFSGGHAYRLFEEQVRQNLTLFERAMKMFTPFGFPMADEASPPQPPAAPASSSDNSLAELKARMEDMQRQIERLAAEK